MSTSLQKRSDFDFFEPCHESAILVDFCMDSLLNIQRISNFIYGHNFVNIVKLTIDVDVSEVSVV